MANQHQYIYQTPVLEETQIERIILREDEPAPDTCKYCGWEVMVLTDKCRNPKCDLWSHYRRIREIYKKIGRWLPGGVSKDNIPCIYAMMAFNCSGRLAAVEALLDIPFTTGLIDWYENRRLKP